MLLKILALSQDIKSSLTHGMVHHSMCK